MRLRLSRPRPVKTFPMGKPERTMIPRTFVDDQNAEDAEARRLIFGSDPLEFADVEPMKALPSDAPMGARLIVLRTIEVPKDGDAVRLAAGTTVRVGDHGTACINRWILHYGARFTLAPKPIVPATPAQEPLEGIAEPPVLDSTPVVAEAPETPETEPVKEPSKRKPGRPKGTTVKARTKGKSDGTD